MPLYNSEFLGFLQLYRALYVLIRGTESMTLPNKALHRTLVNVGKNHDCNRLFRVAEGVLSLAERR